MWSNPNPLKLPTQVGLAEDDLNILLFGLKNAKHQVLSSVEGQEVLIFCALGLEQISSSSVAFVMLNEALLLFL